MSQAKCDELAMNINSQLTKHVSNLITWHKRKQKEREQQAASVQGCQAQDIGPLRGKGQGTEGEQVHPQLHPQDRDPGEGPDQVGKESWAEPVRGEQSQFQQRLQDPARKYHE